MHKVHIVPHVHWDREWYFSSEESKILLVNNLREVLDFLEDHPDYPNYILDGQTSIIDDFARLAPSDMPRFRKLVAEGRLVIGPWYTQTDEMVVGGESIIRNLYYGLKDAKEFGKPMMIGYLPDSFGQTAQMPQILNGFDITRAIFWRGISERHGTDKTEFIWKGSGGSQVTTQLLPLGYAIGKYLPTNPEALKVRMDKYFEVLDRGATTANIVVPNGHDQMPIQKNIDAVLEELRKLYPARDFFISRYEQVFDELEKIDLPEVSGEFIDGKYSRVHRSIFSMRADLKSANTRIENKITNTLEPMMAIAFSLGFAYQAGTIEAIWKDLMENHAHDSMGACCSDKVHAEILARYHSVEERVDRLIDFYERKISEAIPDKKDQDKLVIYNTFQRNRRKVVDCTIISKLHNFVLKTAEGELVPYEIISQEVVDPGLIDRQIVHYGDYDPFIEYKIRLVRELPAVGYEVLYVSMSNKPPQTNLDKKSDRIENDFYIIQPNNNGTIQITEKMSGQIYDKVLNLENVADDGDEYDFSPLPNDHAIYSNEHVVSTASFDYSQNSECLTIIYEWDLPKNLTSREEGRRDGKIAVEIKLELKAGEKVIGLQVKLNNQINDQRTRLLIPTAIASEFSIADNQFGRVTRPVIDEALAIWEKESWDERPDSIYPFLSYVALADEKRTVGIITNSVREYEVVGEHYDTIAITLFRGVGFLGKENLLRRPGRPSGIKLATPDSQMHGELIVMLGLVISSENEEVVKLPLLAKDFLTPIVTYNQIPYNAMKLNKETVEAPPICSLWNLIEDGLVVSTIKVAESQDKVIARFYNTKTNNQQIQSVMDFEILNLAEERVADTKFLEIQPNEIATIVIKDIAK